MKNFLASRTESFRYALSGIRYVINTQKNSWIHLTMMGLVIVLSTILNLGIIQWVILIFCFLLVWITEFFNTSIEAVVDLISPTEHPLAKISKDVSAAAVLIAALGSVVIGLLILGPPLFQFISH